MESFTELIDYQKYCKFMESKKVRYGEERTYTLIDFVTEDELSELNENGINNLSSLDPTPKEIDTHFKFTKDTHRFLLKKYPDDVFLISLELEEKQAFKVCTNWYEKYGIEYDSSELEKLKKLDLKEIKKRR